MPAASDLPRAVRTIETVWITLADGCRLAARIWLPEDAEANPVPAILEYLPYRLNGGTEVRDARLHPYVAGHGYACVRVDQRGSGESDGVLLDEYLPQEQLDACEVIAWLARQPWCTGAVGMTGISWGGFNALQVAARRPPALKAIITVCSTDDRYADDVHYDGGCVSSEMLEWASSMFVWNARPPDPEVVGDRWREMWLERMQAAPPFVEAWLRHQRRDAFWKQGSVCEDYAAIEAAVYAVGGWSDGYTNAVPRLLEGLPGPRKGLIGPWAHAWPQAGTPGPAIGFLQEAVRWWDHWLKGLDTGIMDEPMLRSWIQDTVAPATVYTERPGRWVADPAWPSPNLSELRLALAPGRLTAGATESQELTFTGLQTAGIDAGSWCPYGEIADWPGDQRAMDGMSLTFTSDPLEQPVEILGHPEVTLELSCDRPLGLVAVRLCEVSPDGASLLVTRAVQNLTHRDSDEHPAPLDPGRRYAVNVKLDAIGHAFAPGSRLRVGVSPTYWPFAWPSPEPVRLTLRTGGASELRLPVRSPQAADSLLPEFGPPEQAPGVEYETLREGPAGRSLRHDLGTGRVELSFDWALGGLMRMSSGLEFEDRHLTVFSIVEGDPLSALARCLMTGSTGRGDWRTRCESESLMSSDATTFVLSNTLRAWEGEALVFERTWESRIPRDLV